MKSAATLQRRVLGDSTGQGVRARAVEKVQRQLAELPEETWTNWRMEICVTNGLHWNHWSGNWSRSCWNFCWEIWKLLNGDPIFNLWSLYVFVQIWCLLIQSFSEQKDLQNKWPMVALCAGWYGLRCPWWFLGRSQGRRRVVFFGAQAWCLTLCQAVTDGHVVFLDDAIKKVPGIGLRNLGKSMDFLENLHTWSREDSWVFWQDSLSPVICGFMYSTNINILRIFWGYLLCMEQRWTRFWCAICKFWTPEKAEEFWMVGSWN